MEIFKLRNLALGCGAFLISLYVSYEFNNLMRISVLAISVSLILLFAILYLIKRKRTMLDKIIRYFPLFLFVSLAMIISLFSFGRAERGEAFFDGEEHEIVAKVEREQYERAYQSRYEMTIREIDEQKYNIRALLELEGDGLNVGDEFEARVYFNRLEDSVIGYNEMKAYLDDGISILATTSKYTLISEGEGISYLEKLNIRLSSVLEENLSENSGALFSALLLGNDDLLSDNIKRDCARVGVSHALALSGLHITVIATLLGVIFNLLPLPRALRNLILILLIIFFVALTGFSRSAVRAGLMMTLFYLIKMVGYRVDNITSLFLSVTIICTFMPYSIFSVSLQLSFLAMLGCLISVKYIYKTKLRRVRFKVIRYIVFSFVTTAFVIAFTLPVTFDVFETVSLLTPISNLILVPLFTFLIYFAPFLLFFSGVPYVSDFLFFIGDKCAYWLLRLIEWLASCEGIVLSTYSLIQKIGVYLIILALIVLLFVKKRYIKHVTCLLCVGFLVFSGGSAFNYIDAKCNTYVSSYSANSNDFVALEQNNELTIIDISKTTTGVSGSSVGLINYLHYTEVENYIICDYSHLTDVYFKRVSGNVKIKNLYLPTPSDENENGMLEKIKAVAEKEGIAVIENTGCLELRGTTIEFAPKDTLSRSERRSVSFNINTNGCDFLYLGASSYEIFDYFTEEKSYNADVIIFGAYGPSYKKEYSYEAPYVDKMIFYGESYHYAKESLTSDKEIIVEGIMPERFKATE